MGLCTSLGKTLTGLVMAVGMVLAGEPAQAQRPGTPGDFDYYALVMSWSPSYCAGEGAGRGDPQCAPNRPYAFVLHGLWPQYARGFPNSCRAPTDFVPQPVINGMLDIMPSRNLIIHEFRKHGTCSGLDSKAYFDLARRMYDTIKVPEAYRNLDKPLVTRTADMVQAFVAANPGLRPEMMGIDCGRPNRLKEIRFCFSKDGAFKTCGSNEAPSRMCRSPNLYLPPVRAGGRARGGNPGPTPVEPAVAPVGQRRI